MSYVSPSVRDTAFNCPHCGALASQTWYTLRAASLNEEQRLPKIFQPEDRKSFNFDHIGDLTKRKKFCQLVDKMVDGHPVLGDLLIGPNESVELLNIFLSECFNCKDISVWIYDRLVYPRKSEAPAANADLSEDIRRDYREASSILDLSPRGAAALIRLAIQKLCKQLGQPGRDLNKDIGALVSNGLDEQVRKALDVVRVIGNSAVHPGHLDLRDDRATAESLFTLLNLIAERMISQPRRVNEAYDSLPEGARNAIERRDS